MGVFKPGNGELPMTEQALKKILIFDDDADMRALLKVHLGNAYPGVELEEYDPVVSGVPGSDFAWSRYDALILDYFLRLPGVTGLDILQANRKNPDFPATIMLTGAGNEEVAVRALKAGVHDYLRKQSLDRQSLADAIGKAVEKHRSGRLLMQEATRQGEAFNKAIFYQQLKYRQGDHEFRERVLFLIALDDQAAIAEKAGVILRDNVIRHIAKQSFEVFRLGNCNPNITRLGDHYIALLIDDPGSRQTLEFNLNGLLKHLEKRPYSFGERKLKFTVSIGVVQLTGEGLSPADIIGQARSACASAEEMPGSSYSIFEITPPHTGDTAGSTAPAPPAKEQVSAVEKAKPVPLPAAPKPDVPPKQQAKPAAPVKKEAPAAPRSPVSTPVAPAKEQAKPAPAPAAAPKSQAAAADQAKPAPVATKPQSANAAQSVKPPETPAQPRKTLAELKAEAARLKSAPASPPPAPAVDAESGLDESRLDEGGLALKQGFDEKRVVQSFQPVINLLNEDMDSDDEVHRVGLQHVQNDGSVKTDGEIRSQLLQPEFRKFVDRWLLREIIGFLTNRDSSRYTFIVPVSDASLGDASFFNWLRKLLTGLEAKAPGRHLALELNAADLVMLEKQASALIDYLRKSHDFRFVLGGVDTVADITGPTSRIRFDYIRAKMNIISELQEIPAVPGEAGQAPAAAESESNSHFDLLKSAGVRFIADAIEDATSLTGAISLGAEYATGVFIGEPTSQLDDVTNIESLEIA